MRYRITALFFFFNDTATTEIYTLSLHDALPICVEAFRALPAPSAMASVRGSFREHPAYPATQSERESNLTPLDRKSTRLNSSHANISYAVFCLKKKKMTTSHTQL